MENSIKKYGKENFKREILEICETWEKALEKEKFWIEELQSNKTRYPEGLGMNHNDGGWGGNNISGNGEGKNHPMYGRHHTEETKKHWSDIRTGRLLTEEHKSKITKYVRENPSMKGKHHTEETKELLRLKNTGKKLTEVHKRKIGEANSNKVFSKEHKEKIGNSHRGKKRPKETGEKISKSKRGKHYDKCCKYIYTLSNNYNFYEFFSVSERHTILNIFNRRKSNAIDYKGIVITRTLKESDNK